MDLKVSSDARLEPPSHAAHRAPKPTHARSYSLRAQGGGGSSGTSGGSGGGGGAAAVAAAAGGRVSLCSRMHSESVARLASHLIKYRVHDVI